MADTPADKAPDHTQLWLERSRRQLLANSLTPWVSCLDRVDCRKAQRLAPAIASLLDVPVPLPHPPHLREGTVCFATQTDITPQLRQLIPWRKGPFAFGNVQLISEWDCNRKWQRLASAVDWRGKRLLDVGGGNGYYAWRALLAGVQLAVVADPNPLAWVQAMACQHFARHAGFAYLPVALNQLATLPRPAQRFDLALCLGVLYHSPAPFDLLRQLRATLRPDGAALIDTLVIEGDATRVLVPRQRYAGMSNVWAIPSLAALKVWLERCNWKHVCVVSAPTPTTSDEQSPSEWSGMHSLEHSLDARNPQRTIEGYPAPQRAVVLARA